MILVVGLSHRTAPVDVRERLAVAADGAAPLLVRLASRSELAEAMFLGTCNRVEVFASSSDGKPEPAVAAVRQELARHGGIADDAELAPYLYAKHGDEAVRHVFRVAASLDSMVLGEPQILGQVKQAHDAAVAAGALKGKLQRCLTRAFATAKRVRTETAIGAGSVSIASVAVDLASRVFANLSDHVVLLLGAGEMAEAAARSLGQGARALRICNRNFERAAALAREMHASAVPWEGLEAELLEADMVVASTASQTPVVTSAMVKRAIKARRGRDLLFVDIAVPRNVEPAVHDLENVYVFNVDDLEKKVAVSLQARQDQVERAERIVAEELAQFVSWSRGLLVQPTLIAMRAKVRAALFSELEKTLGGRLKHLPEGDRAALHQMLDSALNKVLHAPTTRLRAHAAEGERGGELAEMVRFLFDLQEVHTAREAEAPESDARGADGEEDGRLPH